VLATAAIYCVLSEYATGEKATVIFSQDRYQSTFCPSPVINFNPESTALRNLTLGRRLILHLRCNFTRIGASQHPAALLILHRRCSISFHTRFPCACVSQLGMAAPQLPVAHLGLDCPSYIESLTPYPSLFQHSSPCMGSAQSACVLLRLGLVLLFILQSPSRLLSPDFALFSSCAPPTLTLHSSFPYSTTYLALLFCWLLLPFFIQIIITFQTSILMWR